METNWITHLFILFNYIPSSAMDLSSFIRDNVEAILQDWEDFARSIQPKSGRMSIAALRNDAKAMMEEIADELETPQSNHEQAEKSMGRNLKPATRTSAGHGLERLDAGFGVTDLISEYRALRAGVFRLWDEIRPQDPMNLYDVIRFNEAIDQRVHEAINAYSKESDRRNRQLEARMQEAQAQVLHTEKLAAVGQLSASIAHEFNSPLQAVMTVLKIIETAEVLKDEERKLLKAAICESQRMKKLIRSLQDFYRPSSGAKTMLNIHQILDSLLLLCKTDFRRKCISTVVNYAQPLPLILAIHDQIKQVFLNLILNAADACQPTGGIITVKTWQVKKRVAVEIQDTGIGIAPDKMDLIFQPFYSTKPEVKGTGLGLSVSYGIVQNHNGEIRVTSEPGKGSRFTVLLPIDGDE